MDDRLEYFKVGKIMHRETAVEIYLRDLVQESILHQINKANRKRRMNNQEELDKQGEFKVAYGMTKWWIDNIHTIKWFKERSDGLIEVDLSDESELIEV